MKSLVQHSNTPRLVRGTLILLILSVLGGCQMSPSQTQPTMEAQRGSSMSDPPPGSSGGSSDGLLDHLAQQTTELNKARERLSQLESDYQAFNKELETLREEYEKTRALADSRGKELEEARTEIANLESTLDGEVDKRAEITDMYLAEKIKRLRYEQDLIQVKLEMLED